MDNKHIITMDKMTQGQFGTVYKMNIDDSVGSRLRELGLIEGTKISALYEAFLGDPVAYYIRGAVIALRKCDSNAVLICVDDKPLQ